MGTILCIPGFSISLFGNFNLPVQPRTGGSAYPWRSAPVKPPVFVSQKPQFFYRF
jgi:hypothetical protein